MPTPTLTKSTHPLLQNPVCYQAQETGTRMMLLKLQCSNSQAQKTPGLKITAGQRTMSDLIEGLTGQTLILLVILTGHFWMRALYIFHIVVTKCILLYNAVMISFFFDFFLLLSTKPLKKKNTTINFMS